MILIINTFFVFLKTFITSDNDNNRFKIIEIKFIYDRA